MVESHTRYFDFSINKRMMWIYTAIGFIYFCGSAAMYCSFMDVYYCKEDCYYFKTLIFGTIGYFISIIGVFLLSPIGAIVYSTFTLASAFLSFGVLGATCKNSFYSKNIFTYMWSLFVIVIASKLQFSVMDDIYFFLSLVD